VLSCERLEPSTGEISTIGLDIEKSCISRCMLLGAVVIANAVSRPKVLDYFGELPPSLVGSKRVRQLTTGAASFKRLVTRLD